MNEIYMQAEGPETPIDSELYELCHCGFQDHKTGIGIFHFHIPLVMLTEEEHTIAMLTGEITYMRNRVDYRGPCIRVHVSRQNYSLINDALQYFFDSNGCLPVGATGVRGDTGTGLSGTRGPTN